MSSEYDFEQEPCRYPDYTPTERSVEDLPATGEGTDGVERRVWDALYEVEDPEMPISIVDLGLIYGVDVVDRVPSEAERGGDDGADVERVAHVEMTLTYTGCPARKMLTDEIADAAASADGVTEVDLRLVFSPEWSIDMVTEQGKEDLREFGLSV